VKTRMYTIVMLALAITIVTAGIGMRPVSAQTCTAQLNYPIMPTFYANSNVPIVVPLSVTCETFYGDQLYATANLYDTVSGNNLGTVSVILPSVNAGSLFNGQLGFNLPPYTQGDTVQVTASIYSSQYGNVITTTSITFQVSGPGQQVATTTVTETTNMYYPYAYPSPTPSIQHPQFHEHANQLLSQNRNQSANNASLLVYVAIAAILAAVLIATAGLVAYARKRTYWVPMPPPLPR
jgi:hypothetical protein